MDGTAILESPSIYLHREAQLARSENENEDFSISLRLLALLRDGWSAGPGIFDLACGYAIGLPHSKIFYKRTKRAAFQQQQFLRLIPDYDWSNEMPPKDDPTDGRRLFYGNRFTGRLCNMGTSPGSRHDTSGIGCEDQDYATTDWRMGDRPEAHDCQSVPGSERAAGRPGGSYAYRGSTPKRISSPARSAGCGIGARPRSDANTLGLNGANSRARSLPTSEPSSRAVDQCA
jgi:hypothetical protein